MLDIDPVEDFIPFDINAGSAVQLELTHKVNRKLTAPSALSYRIDDLTNDHRQVLDWTVVPTPGPENTITVPQALNELFTRVDTDRERRQITVNVTQTSGTVVQEIFIYEIIRIFNSDTQEI